MRYIKSFSENRSPKIPKTIINDILYHGTVVDIEDYLFIPQIGYSDHEALWFADDEVIAEEFSRNHGTEGFINVVFKTESKLENIAEVDYSLSQWLMDYYGLSDFREIINILQNKGFNGWKTTGSLDYRIYNDIAIFDDDLITFSSVKFFVDGDWTDYIPISEAEDFFEEIKTK